MVKNLLANAGDTGDPGSIPESGNPWEEAMTTHSSILPWRMPRSEEPEGYGPCGHKESNTIEVT